MSIFKTIGFVLKIKKIKYNEFLYSIFTYEYGIINAFKVNKSKERFIDLGYIINFEIKTNGKIANNKIQNLKIKSEFLSQERSFDEINTYLSILAIINKNIVFQTPILEIYNIINLINSSKNINIDSLILLKIKILFIAGELSENNEDIIVSKILKFINNNKIERIIKLRGIENDIREKLLKL